MTPEFKDLITSYPDMSAEAAKLIFIRDTALKSYVENALLNSSKETLSEIVTLGTVSAMDKATIAQHIGNLEKARDYLSAHIQGLKIGYATDEEERIKVKRSKETKEPKVSKSSSTPVMNLEDLKNELSNFIAKKNEVKEPVKIVKVTCEKCKAEVISLKFHTCKVVE